MNGDERDSRSTASEGKLTMLIAYPGSAVASILSPSIPPFGTRSKRASIPLFPAYLRFRCHPASQRRQRLQRPRFSRLRASHAAPNPMSRVADADLTHRCRDSDCHCHNPPLHSASPPAFRHDCYAPRFQQSSVCDLGAHARSRSSFRGADQSRSSLRFSAGHRLPLRPSRTAPSATHTGVDTQTHKW